MQTINIVKHIAIGTTSALCALAVCAAAALADKTVTYIDRGYTEVPPAAESTTTTVESGAGFGGTSTTTSTTVASPARVTEVERPIIIKEKKKSHHLIHAFGVSVF
jgi:hypothetical protein